MVESTHDVELVRVRLARKRPVASKYRYCNHASVCSFKLRPYLTKVLENTLAGTWYAE
jgi:hypothetical protein